MGIAFQTALQQGQRAPEKVLARMSRTLPACDVAVAECLEIRAGVREEIRRSKASTAGRAATLDLRLQLRPWGFRAQDIAMPVHVWHGDLDRNVVEEGIYLAEQIPHAAMHELPDAGHGSCTVISPTSSKASLRSVHRKWLQRSESGSVLCPRNEDANRRVRVAGNLAATGWARGLPAHNAALGRTPQRLEWSLRALALVDVVRSAASRRAVDTQVFASRNR